MRSNHDRDPSLEPLEDQRPGSTPCDGYLTLTQAARELPGRPHLSTIHRWRLHGVRGVRLRTCLVGGRRFTRREWLSQFIKASSEAGERTSIEAASEAGERNSIAASSEAGERNSMEASPDGEARRRSEDLPAVGGERPVREIIAEVLDRHRDTLTTADQLPETASEVSR